MITAGIDMGSRSVKVVLLEELDMEGKPQLVVKKAHLMLPGDLDADQAAEQAYDAALQAAGVARGDVKSVFATGAGRNQVAFATEGVTEMTAGARGAVYMYPQARTVVDVGAEEGRGIKTDSDGKAIDFAGNEKCAAGAGSFAEAMSRALQLSLKEFGEASLRSDKSIPMNAQCTVFAESEVVSLIHSSTPKEDIAKAVLDAVASRVCAMVRRVGIEGNVVLIGGMGHNPGFVASLKNAMEVDEVLLPELPEFASALGCALIAAERLH
ncbi:acyl-CoA dehydratase activase [Aromatoleum evansii]|uniref:Acyl-CoA dehydratase activase n=1 Tax=Aromatoleum evansii TaxID=59406 RepID=A0ABZ1AKB8_AROEV|nr:acyl-CoA dehydratase activase [Aromatoleum evansii]NMG27604.1 CoA activase [Aromatoleum evansii]WRL46306.1 acyl-CoA dehydratase activase [Aromatoleum evansii]